MYLKVVIVFRIISLAMAACYWVIAKLWQDGCTLSVPKEINHKVINTLGVIFAHKEEIRP